MNTDKFRKLIKEKRLENGISQRALAKKLSCVPSYIVNIEKGLFKPPKEEVIIKIANLFDINEDYLLGLAGKVSKDIIEAIAKDPIDICKYIRSRNNN